MAKRTLFLVIILTSAFCSLAQKDIAQFNDNPAEFIPNRGQWKGKFQYKATIPKGHLFFENNGFTYFLRNQDQWGQNQMRRHDSNFRWREADTIDEHAFKMEFVNAQKDISIFGQNPTEHYYNYFFENVRVSNVKPVNLLIYNRVYDNIDLVVNGQKGSIKYDWVIFPDGNPDDINIKFTGTDSLQLFNNHLVIHTSVGEIIETPPIAFQPKLNSIAGGYDTIPCQFQLNGNTLSYAFPDGYDKNRKLIIDPELIFSTYSGSEGDNFGFTATYDSKANLYAGGSSNGAEGPYPVTTGAFQTVYAGGGVGRAPVNLSNDVTISKYDSSGNKLLWASYLGGRDDEFPHSLVVDENDNLYVLGTTYSDNFPTTPNAYDRTFNDTSNSTDIYVAFISEDGKELKGCTYIGGKQRDGLNSSGLNINYADDFRGDIIPDNRGDIYIASCTESVDFPLAKAFDKRLIRQEGVAISLTADLSKLRWSTFLGGDALDALYSIKVDADSMVYVGGGSNSTDLPKTQDAFITSRQGAIDGFISSFNRNTYELQRTTYYGTDRYDQVYFIDYDFKGNLYLAGQTEGNIAPSNSNLYGTENRGQFIAKMDTSLKNLEWQTAFGNRDNELTLSPSAFLVDNCDHIYYSGWGRFEAGILTTDLETTADAIQQNTDGNDFYILVLNKNAEGLLYATYFGGDQSHDHVDGGTSRFDKRGVVYQSVCSSCPRGNPPGFQDFPVTADAVFTSNVSPRCSNASFKIDLQIRSAVIADFTPDPSIGCTPLSINIQNRSSIAEKFYWDFGDGRPIDSTNLNPSVTYTEPGTYTITLTVIDSNSCNISDVFKRKITVLGSSNAAFTYSVEPCSYNVQFSNSSSTDNVLWRFGDGTEVSEENPIKEYEPNARDIVWLYTDLGTLCADSISQEIEMADQLTSNYIFPNFFSPNEDGLNDEFCLDGFTANCDTIEWTIYSRWGECVFSSTDIFECWNGKVNQTEKAYPEGTYYAIYRIKERGSNTWYTISGQVALMR